MKAARKSADKVRVVGFVTPSEWTSKNEIKRISLLTVDQEEVYIVKNKKAERLFSLLWEKVEVTGRVQVDRQGHRNIMVEHYRTSDFEAVSGDYETGGYGATDELRDVLGTSSWYGYDEADLPRNL
jgi:hypothetical protein